MRDARTDRGLDRRAGDAVGRLEHDDRARRRTAAGSASRAGRAPTATALPGMRKLSLDWPSSDPASTRIATAATIHTPMNHQRCRTARRPRRSRSLDTVRPFCRCPCCAPISSVSAHPRVPLDTRTAPSRRGTMSRMQARVRGRSRRRGRVLPLVSARAPRRRRRRRHLRLEALARFLQDVATDDADDAGLSEARGVWVVRSSDLEIVAAAHVPRHGRARDVLQRHRAAVGRAPDATRSGSRRGRRSAPACGCSSTAQAAGRSRSTTSSTSRYAEAARGRRVSGRLRARAPPADATAAVAAAHERLRRARPREQRAVARSGRGRAGAAAARAGSPVRARIEYRGTLERGDAVALASEREPGGRRRRAGGVARRSAARSACRPRDRPARRRP